MGDTILCSSKEEAKRYVDEIGGRYIKEFEYEGEKVRIILNCRLQDIADKGGE